MKLLGRPVGTQRGYSTGSELSLLAAAFVLSRILYYAAGVRFDAAPLNFYSQYVDPHLLRTDLWRSLHYLEQQPPLFNFYLGAVLRCFPAYATAVFHLTHLLLGLAVTLGLYLLMGRMGLSRPIALALTMIYTVSPASVLYENLLFYEYALAALMCLSALFLHRYASGGRSLDGFCFFCCLALLSGIRSIYHLVWFALLTAYTCYAVRAVVRRTIAVALLPFAFVLSFYLKNLILFASIVAGGSAYGGVNLATMAALPLSLPELEKLAASRRISPAITRGACDLVPDLGKVADVVPPPSLTGFPLLDYCFKSTGTLNFNCRWLGEIGELCAKDARTVVRLHPQIYLRSVCHNVLRYFRPSTDQWPFDGRPPGANWAIVHRLLRVYDLLTSGEAPPVSKYPWLNYLVFPAIYGFGLLQAITWPAGARKRLRLSDPAFTTLVYMLFQVGYLSATVILLSALDQNRYRFEVSCFWTVLLGLALTRLLRRGFAVDRVRAAD